MSAETKGRYSTEPASVAYTDDPVAACPGGQLLADCETVTGVLQDLADFANPQGAGATETKAFTEIEGKVWRIPKWLSVDCATCGQQCEPALQTEGSEPTGLTKVSFHEIVGN